MKRTVVVLVALFVLAATFTGVRASDRPSKAEVIAAAERAGKHPTAVAIQWSWAHLDWQTHEIYDL